jgi:hypothetical protein
MPNLRFQFSSKHIYALCGFTLIALNIWSLHAVRRLTEREDRQPPGIEISALPRLQAARLRNGSHPFANIGHKGRYVLLYVFSPFDCPTAAEELEEIQKLHEEQPDIDIRALLFNVSNDEARETEKRFQLTFPVIADQAADLRMLLAPPQTPWKILFNPSTLEILMEDPPSISVEEKKAFHSRVVYLIHGAQNRDDGLRL